MKTIVLFLFSFIPVLSFSQDFEIITGVCGTEFGTPFSIAKDKIQAFFEEQNNPPQTSSVDSTSILSQISEMGNLLAAKRKPSPLIIGNTIQYMYQSFEGIKFENIYFNFDDEMCFSSVSFWIYCENKKEALKTITEIADVIQMKHTLFEGRSDDGTPIYGGGFPNKESNKCGIYLHVYENKDVVLSFQKVKVK